MSTPAEINAVFGFNRTLPPPFDSLKSKTVKVCSKHGTGDSTLTTSVIKAVHAVCHCMVRDGEGAVGTLDTKNVAEYKSSNAPNEYHLAVYDNSNGNILVSIFEKGTDIITNYVCTKNDKDGAAIMMAMFPTFTKDPEFQENFEAYYEALTAGYPDMTAATNAMAIMCDNVYRRLTNDALPEHIKLEMTKDGKVTRISSAQIDSNKFTPKEVVAGEFTIVCNESCSRIGSLCLGLKPLFSDHLTDGVVNCLHRVTVCIGHLLETTVTVLLCVFDESFALTIDTDRLKVVELVVCKRILHTVAANDLGHKS